MTSKNPTIQDINAQYGNLLWKTAVRYSKGLMIEAEDIYHEALIGTHARLRRSDRSLDDFPWVRSAIISSSIDACRSEVRASRLHTGDIGNNHPELLSSSDNRENTPSLEQSTAEQEEIIALIAKHTSPEDAAILAEVLFPGEMAHTFARRDCLAAKEESDRTGHVKMNMHACKVMKKHIAEALGVNPRSIAPSLARSRHDLGALGHRLTFRN